MLKPFFNLLAPGIMAMRFCICLVPFFPIHAATLTWDANGSASPGPFDGSGNWNTANDWWNGSANQSWASGSDAIFGSGTGSAGAYFVTNNSALMQPNSITFTNPGSYTITTDGTDVGELSWTSAAGGVGAASKGLWVGTNVSASINVPWDDANGSDIFLGSNSALTFSQGNFGSLGTLLLKGSGAAFSIVNITNGAWTSLPGTMDLCGVTLNINNSGAIDAGTRLDIGRPATGAPGSDGIVNVSNGGQFNVNVTADTDPNANLQVSRGGPGTLNISSGGFASTLSDGTSGRLLLIPDSSSHATVNMSGGTLNVGTGINGTSDLNSSLLNLITLMQGAMSYGGSASAIFNLSGGVVTASGIQIGSASGTFTANPTNQINVTGGTLYLGALNINRPVSTGTKSAINLSGGTIAAIANWSPACSVPINLTNINGDITFQAADGRGNPFDISIAGPMTGIGGFKATGDGMLTLTGTNTYTGFTGINDGTVLLTGQGSMTETSGIDVTNNGALILFNTSTANNPNRISNVAPITMDGGAFSFINDGNVANFNEAAGGLVIDSDANVITVYPATNSQASQLAFSSITDTTGSVNFLMAAAGTSQNKVLFNTPPAIGSWVTVNGDPATYDSVNGLQSAVSYTDIGALGSTIVNSPSSNVRIRTMGSGGNIQLSSSATAISSLKQDTTTPAIVNAANDVLQVNDIAVYAGAQSLTIGTAPASGILEAAAAGGNLTLDNDGGFAPGLVINAAIADNTFPSSLSISGAGSVTLGAPNNTYSGGTMINGGTLVVVAGTTVAMPYTNVSGTLEAAVGAPGASLPMTTFSFSGNQPQVGFNLMAVTNSSTPVIDISGSLTLNGNVYVDITNPVPGTTILLQYGGVRTGSGRFLAGNVPAGTSIVDDPDSHQVTLVYLSGPTAFVPTHNTNQVIIAVATPQEYGAVGDGVTDDSVAFQNALNAVNASGGVGGGVVYVPSGTYAFSNSITIPPGVTLQGDWADWSQGSNGVVGTLFKVYAGAGQSNGAPFITMNQSALKGVSIWYPNQNPSSITPYPFTIYIENYDTVVQDVALINSYQGIEGQGAAKHVIADVFGSPLYTGIQVDAQYDISHQDNVRFSPDFWPTSLLPGAPTVGGPHATWMRTNGAAERLYRADGEACMDVDISGYNIGFDALQSANGTPDVSFYEGYISNCATAFFDAAGGGDTGMEFTDFTLEGDTAVDRNSTNPAAAFFHTCQIVGSNGISIHQTGSSSSTMQFQDCNITGTVKEDGGVANFVNCYFTVPSGSNQCTMDSGAIYAAFTGCIFNPVRQISNATDARRLVIDGRRAFTSPLPIIHWSDVESNWAAYRPANSALFVATSAPWNAVGDGVTDATEAIQAALNAAGANGGGIVYLPPGKYKLTNTLDVPSGIELLGSYPSRHSASLYDGNVIVTVLQPYEGQGTTNGPPAVALEANAGIVGLSITYESQNTNCIPYPPAIQGRGPNVYAYGIQCPNAYWYVDLNTYTCTNHFFYQVDGWSLDNGFTIGNGSSGSIIECMANLSYWADNTVSASVLSSAWQPPVQEFVEHNLNWFTVGDCHELMVKDFDYRSDIFMDCIAQNGNGPWINGVLTMCDAAVICFKFESAASSWVNIVNPEWMVTLADYSDLTNYGVLSTPTFQGTARFFNAPLWGGRPWDYVIQGGDVGFELTHAGYVSTYGSRVDGGAAHFVNAGWLGNTSSSYTIPFNSPSNGVPGKLSEIVGSYAWTGVTNTLANVNNPVVQWGNFGINTLLTQTPFNVTPPILSLNPSPSQQTISLVWTNNMGAFNLLSTPNLAQPGTWLPVTNIQYFATNTWTVVGFPANEQCFYRLGQ